MRKTNNSSRFNKLDLHTKQKFFHDAIQQYRRGDYSQAENASNAHFFLIGSDYKIYQTKYLYAICVMKYIGKSDYSYETVKCFCENEGIRGGKSKYTADTYIKAIIADYPEYEPKELTSRKEKEYYRSKYKEYREVQYIDDVALETNKEYVVETDGGKKQIYTTRYERNPKLRNKAIKIHGTTCMACGFDFGKTYGASGEGYIEVHHIIPLSDSGEEVEVNPITDLIVVCSNCHRMIHRKKNHTLTLEELRGQINGAR